MSLSFHFDQPANAAELRHPQTMLDKIPPATQKRNQKAWEEMYPGNVYASSVIAFLNENNIMVPSNPDNAVRFFLSVFHPSKVHRAKTGRLKYLTSAIQDIQAQIPVELSFLGGKVKRRKIQHGQIPAIEVPPFIPGEYGKKDKKDGSCPDCEQECPISKKKKNEPTPSSSEPKEKRLPTTRRMKSFVSSSAVPASAQSLSPLRLIEPQVLLDRVPPATQRTNRSAWYNLGAGVPIAKVVEYFKKVGVILLSEECEMQLLFQSICHPRQVTEQNGHLDCHSTVVAEVRSEMSIDNVDENQKEISETPLVIKILSPAETIEGQSDVTPAQYTTSKATTAEKALAASKFEGWNEEVPERHPASSTKPTKPTTSKVAFAERLEGQTELVAEHQSSTSTKHKTITVTFAEAPLATNKFRRRTDAVAQRQSAPEGNPITSKGAFSTHPVLANSETSPRRDVPLPFKNSNDDRSGALTSGVLKLPRMKVNESARNCGAVVDTINSIYEVRRLTVQLEHKTVLPSDLLQVIGLTHKCFEWMSEDMQEAFCNSKGEFLSITNVDKGSVASAAGFEAGDVWCTRTTSPKREWRLLTPDKLNTVILNHLVHGGESFVYVARRISSVEGPLTNSVSKSQALIGDKKRPALLRNTLAPSYDASVSPAKAVTPNRSKFLPRMTNKRRLPTTKNAPPPPKIVKLRDGKLLDTTGLIKNGPLGPADVVLSMPSAHATLYTAILESWCEVYEAASHQEKRNICRLAIDEMNQKGVRFLASAGAPGWLAVETHTSERILNKIVRAIKQACNSRNHAQQVKASFPDASPATKAKKLLKIYGLQPRDVVVNSNFSCAHEPLIFRHIIAHWRKFFIVASNLERSKICLQVIEEMKSNSVRFVEEAKPGLFLLGCSADVIEKCVLQAFRNSRETYNQATLDPREEAEFKQQYIQEFLATAPEKITREPNADTPNDASDVRRQMTERYGDTLSSREGSRREVLADSPENEKQHTRAPIDANCPQYTSEERKRLYVRESLTESRSASLSGPPFNKVSSSSPEKKQSNNPDDNFEARKHLYVLDQSELPVVRASSDSAERKQQNRLRAIATDAPSNALEAKTQLRFRASRAETQDEAMQLESGKDTPNHSAYARVVDASQEQMFPVPLGAKSADCYVDDKSHYIPHHGTSSDESSKSPADETDEETKKRYIEEFMAESQDAYSEFPVYSAMHASAGK